MEYQKVFMKENYPDGSQSTPVRFSRQYDNTAPDI
jgi:hypothetical protein